ncbi:hypothetical protein GCM10007423_27120 [Dyadobacter endophyticus]|uniref:Uncharacterized protein n=1 Tax=Dyadobacter endophyticus TaxID=1749036 RepID=A0ABQ1YRU9_9BACT|nr:hypothetical protein GCM10007423_27120 [Dyadobacter endophyticus]
MRGKDMFAKLKIRDLAVLPDIMCLIVHRQKVVFRERIRKGWNGNAGDYGVGPVVPARKWVVI